MDLRYIYIKNKILIPVKGSRESGPREFRREKALCSVRSGQGEVCWQPWEKPGRTGWMWTNTKRRVHTVQRSGAHEGDWCG